jgi:hypothetical protein
MKQKRILASALVLGLILVLVAGLSVRLPGGPAHAQDGAGEGAPQGVTAPQADVGTAFTYQGMLTDGGSPADGEYDFQFTLHDDPTAGTPVGSPVAIEDHLVTDGLFTVHLDFGQVFGGAARFLEIGVRPGNSGGAYTTLTPRQELTPAPYALALPGLWTQQNAESPNIIGGYSGNSVAPGVAGAVIGGGGNDAWPNAVLASYGTIGGGRGNVISSTTAYATIGGGYSNDIGNGSDWSSIGGGHGNEIGDSSVRATIGGGYNNDIGDSSDNATIGGGYDNNIGDSCARATVGGGHSNDIGNDSSTATIGGGGSNYIGDSSARATIGGGAGNHIWGSSTNATIGGGESNDIGDSSDNATIGGGYNNVISDTTVYATIPGGRDNEVSGDYAFAAGRRAKAEHDGAFVWADSNDFDFASFDLDTFSARATGGARLVLGIDGSGGATWSCAVINGTSWSCSSDRNLKENLQRVEGGEVLRRLQEVPIYTWNAKGQEMVVPHMGPMAQDFFDAFGLGNNDTHISTIDLDGVALAAIQGLYAQNQELATEVSAYKAENTALKAETSAQQAQIDGLEARLTALERGGVSRSSALGLPAWLLLGGLVLAGGVALRQRWTGGEK